MPALPDDLLPLADFGWTERPASLPLDVEECRTALWLNGGDIPGAAARLRITPGRLRAYVNASPRLQRDQHEAQMLLVDRAKVVVREALNDVNNTARMDNMARYMLNSRFAEEFGFAPRPAKINLLPAGPMIIGWANEAGFDNDAGKDAMTIEHKETDGAAE